MELHYFWSTWTIHALFDCVEINKFQLQCAALICGTSSGSVLVVCAFAKCSAQSLGGHKSKCIIDILSQSGTSTFRRPKRQTEFSTTAECILVGVKWQTSYFCFGLGLGGCRRIAPLNILCEMLLSIRPNRWDRCGSFFALWQLCNFIEFECVFGRDAYCTPNRVEASDWTTSCVVVRG